MSTPYKALKSFSSVKYKFGIRVLVLKGVNNEKNNLKMFGMSLTVSFKTFDDIFY
jgi:hypothetical protein